MISGPGELLSTDVRGMAEHLQLSEAISRYVRDGDTVAIEGFTHLIPFAAGHEIIRQGKRNLTVSRMTPDLIYDQLIGAGCVGKLLFSWGGNPGVGSLYRFRDAVQNGWPVPIELEEHSHAGLTNRYVAGASGMPFTVMKGYLGNSLGEIAPHVRFLECPFTGEQVAAVRSLNPDTGILHAQRADRAGNVQLWGISGVFREVVMASRRVIVTVEEVVDVLDRRPGDFVMPAMAITAVCEVPNGAWPSYVQDYYERDNVWYRKWPEVSRDREVFLAWLDEHVMGA